MLTRLLKALGPLLILLCLTAAASAEVQRHPLLDSAFKLLEKDNIFQRRYNELTGAQVTSLFDTGMPYLYGGAPDKRLMSRYPEFAKRKAWETTDYYRKDRVYVYGLDCFGFSNWVRKDAGLPKLPTAAEILNYWDKRDQDLWTGGWNWPFDPKPLPAPEKMHEELQIGDVLIMRAKHRHIMLYIGTLRDYGFTSEEVPELADYLDYPLGIHCSAHPRYSAVFEIYIEEHPEYFFNCETTDGGVNVSILYVPPEAAPYHEHIQVTDFDYFLIDEGRYQMTIRPTEDLRAFTWWRP